MRNAPLLGGGLPLTQRSPNSSRRITSGGAALPKRATVSASDPNSFDPSAQELTRTWWSYAKTILCLNSYPNGISVSVHHPAQLAQDNALQGYPEAEKRTPNTSSPADEIAPASETDPLAFHSAQFYLRLRETRDYQLPLGKHFLYKENFAAALERHLKELHASGALASTVVYLGTTTDPFHSFQKKFNVTLACLQLLEQYRPGFTVIQSRSSMIIAALPTLKNLASQAVVGIPIESRLESAIQRYTPGQSRLAERLLAADGLRVQGIKVQLIAAPILPYGDPERHAIEFAQLLDAHSDFISVGCLASGSQTDESQLRLLPLARRLVADNQFRWLRPHCYRQLYLALKQIAPAKLLLPVEPPVEPSQLSLFAA